MSMSMTTDADDRSTIRGLAADVVRRRAELDPVWATSIGIPGHDADFGDYSPDGVAARRELATSTLTALDRTRPRDDVERVAGELMRERLTTQLDLDAAEWFRDLESLGSPLQTIRRAFDLMPTATADDWAAVVSRLRGVGAALDGYRTTLQVGLDRGLPSTVRQTQACRSQAATFAGLSQRGPAFTVPLLAAHEAAGAPLHHEEVRAAADAAVAAFGRFAAWLGGEYLPRAEPRDGVGEERYGRFAAQFTGARLDLAEVEAWGWEELARLQEELRTTADAILPGAEVGEVVGMLQDDPERSITGGDAVIAWLQDLLDRTIDQLDGAHFSIPAPLRRLEVVTAPPGGPPVAYYTGPDEDFTRPGRYWFPAADRTRFPLWQEVSIAYHEGVPGHHLEIATQQYQRDRLTRFQTTTLISGYSEGWALYAERLMEELGYLDDPVYRLGMLAAQAFRAMRVVVDTGLHLGLRLPDHVPDHGGKRWTPELARDFIGRVKFLPEQAVEGEITRYLGLPAQAISYKLGERVWRRSREQVRRAQGAEFSLTDFHARALSLGAMGLDQLERELTRV